MIFKAPFRVGHDGPVDKSHSSSLFLIPICYASLLCSLKLMASVQRWIVNFKNSGISVSGIV